MKFSCDLKNALLIIRECFDLSFAIKTIGLPCCTFFAVTVTCSLRITLLSNYSLLIISVLAENTLLETTCHFLLLLIGFDTLTYEKDYDRSPILVGHQYPNFHVRRATTPRVIRVTPPHVTLSAFPMRE